jgi:cytoskeleton protein RodZ
MSENAETLGKRLQAARSQKGLTCQKAADELHLDGWVIEGLESGNYERIGPPVYAKGHLRRYAELLGLPVAEVLADFDGAPAVIPPPPPPPAVGMRMRTAAAPGEQLPWPAIAAAAVIVLFAAGLVWWRPWHSRVPSAATVAAGSSPASLTPAAPASTAAPAAAPSAPFIVAAPPAAAAAPTAALPVAGVADPKAGMGRARLRLSFLGDSWVDVHDAAGQRLFAGTGHVNNVRSMFGEAPLRIYLKSASRVHVEINNHAVAIGPQFVVADVAHFEAGADGVLRRDPHVAPAK